MWATSLAGKPLRNFGSLNLVVAINAGFYKIVVSNPCRSPSPAAVAQADRTGSSRALLRLPLQQPGLHSNLRSRCLTPAPIRVNSINNPKDVGSIKNVVYSLANLFDFALPCRHQQLRRRVGPRQHHARLGHGAVDTLFPGVDGITRFGAPGWRSDHRRRH